MCNILVSVIIPHKNTPTLLERCLKSIPKSESFQVIVVDDSSDDELISNDAFPGVGRVNCEVIFLKESRGAGYARNVGLGKARGRWILFADADDYFVDGFEEIISEYISTSYDLVYFAADSVHSVTGKESSRNKVLNYDIANYKSNHYSSLLNLIYRNWVPWSKLFNRALIFNNNLNFEEVLVGNDAKFVISAGELAQNIHVDSRPLYCVTFNDKSLTYNVKSLRSFDERISAKIRINRFLIERRQYGYLLPVFGDLIKCALFFGVGKAYETYILFQKSGIPIFSPFVKTIYRNIVVHRIFPRLRF